MWPDLKFPPINLYSVPRKGPLIPCVKLCKLDGGICSGCGRTIDEIRHWSELSDEKRMEIIKRLRFR